MLSDRAGAGALKRADAAGIPSTVVPWEGNRAAFTRDVCGAVRAAGAEAIVMAGFMRVLGPQAMERFPGRILNIHPSLLPSFPGAEAVDRALEHGVKLTGVTVHFVDEEVDHGPIIAQVAVEVAAEDDAASLHGRIQAEEHRVYPEVVAALASGRLQLRGRWVDWRTS